MKREWGWEIYTSFVDSRYFFAAQALIDRNLLWTDLKEVLLASSCKTESFVVADFHISVLETRFGFNFSFYYWVSVSKYI